MAYDCCGHDPDRPGPCDEDVLAKHREAQGGMDCVAERVEDRRHIGIDRSRVSPYVGGGHRDELREPTIAVDADAHGVGAELPAPGEA